MNRALVGKRPWRGKRIGERGRSVQHGGVHPRLRCAIAHYVVRERVQRPRPDDGIVDLDVCGCRNKCIIHHAHVSDRRRGGECMSQQAHAEHQQYAPKEPFGMFHISQCMSVHGEVCSWFLAKHRGCGGLPVRNRISPTGNPPALPEDWQSLTVPGIVPTKRKPLLE